MTTRRSYRSERKKQLSLHIKRPQAVTCVTMPQCWARTRASCCLRSSRRHAALPPDLQVRQQHNLHQRGTRSSGDKLDSEEKEEEDPGPREHLGVRARLALAGLGCQSCQSNYIVEFLRYVHCEEIPFRRAKCLWPRRIIPCWFLLNVPITQRIARFAFTQEDALYVYDKGTFKVKNVFIDMLKFHWLREFFVHLC